jgi:hypothetical protein
MKTLSHSKLVARLNGCLKIHKIMTDSMTTGLATIDFVKG